MTIGEKLSALVERVEHIGETVDEVKELAERTNGRVTDLERWRIEHDTREDERRRQAAAAAAAEAARAARRSWMPASATAVGCLFLGAALERLLG